jgi:hypothetical protein
MNPVFRAVLWTTLSSITALAQNTTWGDESYHRAEMSSQYTGTATLIGSYVAKSDAARPFTGRMCDNATALRLSLLRPNDWQSAPSGSATFRILMPFSYRSSRDRSDYFPIKLGPIRYTFWPRVSQSERPAGGWLQNVVDGVLRHYTSDPVVAVNKRCLRALSCNSLYEQALRRRAAPSIMR